jgi:protein TonB
MLRAKNWLGRIAPLLPKKITFAAALSLSLAVHAIVLAIHFDLPDMLEHATDQALEVILVNSRSAHRPTDAQALAQANLDGGGNTDENRRARTPLPASQKVRAGNDLLEARRRVAEKEAQIRQLLAQTRSAATVRSEVFKNDLQPAPQPVTGLDMASNALAIARLQAQIDRQTEEYNKRPRRKFIGVRTVEYRFAQYVEDMLQKIEHVGSLNYPEAARGKLSGSLILTIEVRSDGEIVSVVLDKPSGQKILDEAARRIVRMAGPYPSFPPNIRDTDILTITRHWNFVNGSSLQVN